MEDMIEVHRGCTEVIELNLGHPLGDDTYTSQIRVGQNPTSELIATWTVEVRNANNGILSLKLDDSVTAAIEQSYGWMDVKRVSNGEPLFECDPIPVVFKNVVTA